MRITLRKISIVLAFLMIFAVASQIMSCEETDEVPNGDCTGCPSSTPWSKAGSGNCYATQAECEAAEGSGCVLCE